MSAAVNVRTTAQVRGRGVTRPSATSSRSASRTGIRLTAISAAMSRSTSRDPGARPPSMISSRSIRATRSDSGSNPAVAGSVLRSRWNPHARMVYHFGMPFSPAPSRASAVRRAGGRRPARRCSTASSSAPTASAPTTRPRRLRQTSGSADCLAERHAHPAVPDPDHEEVAHVPYRRHPLPVPSRRGRRPPAARAASPRTPTSRRRTTGGRPRWSSPRRRSRPRSPSRCWRPAPTRTPRTSSRTRPSSTPAPRDTTRSCGPPCATARTSRAPTASAARP